MKKSKIYLCFEIKEALYFAKKDLWECGSHFMHYKENEGLILHTPLKFVFDLNNRRVIFNINKEHYSN